MNARQDTPPASFRIRRFGRLPLLLATFAGTLAVRLIILRRLKPAAVSA